jgi:thiocyanate hydrolase gamma subunit
MSAGHDHEHDHDHGHEHPAAPVVDDITDFEVLEIAVRELAIEKGLFTAEDHRKFTEWAETIGPAGGSRLVAKAWTDPDFKARCLTDAVAACREIGIDWLEPTGTGTPSDYTELHVLENTPSLHHVIVCTLCSCYPRPLLGMSPEWYRTPNYRRRLVRWPRVVLAEFGLVIPPEVEVRVEDSNQKCRFMVMPMRPPGTEGWTEAQLAEIVTRDCMIGVALPRADRRADDARPVQKARRPVHPAAAAE